MNHLTPVKIIIADDSSAFRRMFKIMLNSRLPGAVEVIGEASNGKQLVELVDKLHPDIVFTDVRMPHKNGIEACTEIQLRCPSAKVIALSSYCDVTNIIKMIMAGANGFISKHSDAAEVVGAIECVRMRLPYYCSTTSKILGAVSGPSAQPAPSNEVVFGEKEVDVIKLLCKQMTIKEIAAELNLSSRTVEHYRQNVQRKIGAKNAVGIALYAAFRGIVSFSELNRFDF